MVSWLAGSIVFRFLCLLLCPDCVWLRLGLVVQWVVRMFFGPLGLFVVPLGFHGVELGFVLLVCWFLLLTSWSVTLAAADIRSLRPLFLLGSQVVFWLFARCSRCVVADRMMSFTRLMIGR